MADDVVAKTNGDEAHQAADEVLQVAEFQQRADLVHRALARNEAGH